MPVAGERIHAQGGAGRQELEARVPLGAWIRSPATGIWSSCPYG